MESWRNVWRDGFAPVLSTAGLTALKAGLESDDQRLVQGATTTPPPLMCVQDWPIEAADAIGYAGWKGDGLVTVGEVEEHFAKCCFDADQRLGEPAACRWFLNWFDDTPRDEMRRELLAEVVLALEERMNRRRFAIDYKNSSVVVGVTDDGLCGFVECATMYSPKGPRKGQAQWYQSWATESQAGVDLCRAVAEGKAHPGVLADWIEEHPTIDREKHGKDAWRMAGMGFDEMCAKNYLRRVTEEIKDFIVNPREEDADAR